MLRQPGTQLDMLMCGVENLSCLSTRLQLCGAVILAAVKCYRLIFRRVATLGCAEDEKKSKRRNRSVRNVCQKVCCLRVMIVPPRS